MSTLASTIRSATRRAETGDEKEEDTVRKTKSAEETEDEMAEEETDDTVAESEEEEPEAEEEKEPAAAAAPRAGYSLATATATLELCALAGTTAREAHRFVNARTPLATVRAKLAAQAAPSAERLDPSRPKNEAASSWDDVIAKTNAALPAAARR